MFSHPWNKSINNSITISFAFLLFAVPLIFWPTTSELFEFNKMMLTYIITGLIVSLYLTKAFLNKQLTIARTPLDFPILLFLTAQIITTVLSINPHTSIWGYYSRFHGGLASTITYILLFYIANTHFSATENRPRIKFLFYSLLSSTMLVAGYGVLEHFGIDKHIWVQDVQNRVFSTLGQPNWLSAYLVAILPLPLLLLLNSKRWQDLSIYTIITLTIFAAILFTKSKSGIGTTFIILSLTTLYQLLSKKKEIRHLIPATSTFLLSILISIVIIGTPWSPNPQNIIETLKIGGPLFPQAEPLFNKLNLTTQLKPLDISALPLENQEYLAAQEAGRPYGGSNSWEIRQVVWEGAIKLFKDHPITGTGPETFGYSYYWTRPLAHNLLSEWDFLYNKAHNEYLNYLATTGFIGISSYILLIIGTLYVLQKLHRQHREHRLIIASLSFSYLSILITNYFGFSVVPIAIIFFLIPAIALAQSEAPQKLIHLGSGWNLTKKELKLNSKTSHNANLSLYQYLGITFAFLLFFAWFTIIARHWLADSRYTKGKTYNQAGYVSQALPLLESAVNLYPTEPNFRAVLAESYANAALATKQQFDSLPATQAAQLEKAASEQQQKYTQQAEESIDIATKQNPYHLNLIKSKAKIYLTLAQLDPQYYQQALNTLLRATELAPTDAKLVYNIGLIYLQLEEPTKAETAFKQAVNLKPNYDQAIAELTKIYITNNQIDLTKPLMDQLLFYYPNHPFHDTYSQLTGTNDQN